jgi:hypothetical protein
MKKLLIYAVTLSLATPGFAKTNRVSKTHAPNLERGTLSSLVLSTEEFKRLSSDDRTIYMMSMLALTEVLEISQDQVMGKMSSDKTVRNGNPWHEFWAQALLNPAEAQGYLAAIAAGAKEAGALSMTVGRSVATAVPKLYQGVKNYASAAYELVGGSKGAAETAAAASKGVAVKMNPVTGAYAAKGTMTAGNLGVEGAAVANSAAMAEKGVAAGASAEKVVSAGASTAKTAAATTEEAAKATASAVKAATAAEKAAIAAAKAELETSTKAFAKADKAMKEAEEAFNAGKLGKTQYKAAVAEQSKAVTKMVSDFRVFVRKGGSLDEVSTVLKNSGVNKIPNASKWSKLKLWALGGTIGGGYLVGKFMDDDEGLTPEQAAQEAMAPQSAQIGAEASAAAAATGSTSAKTVAAPATEVGNSCVFGLHPSKWTNQNGQVLCTRPASSSNAKCNGSKFQCPANGLADSEGSIEGKLCIDTQPLTDLTARCSKTLRDILTTMKTTIKPEDYAKFAEQLKGFLLYVESKEGMKNEKNETKSILEYCSTDNTLQTEECKAINGIVAVMKEYGSGKQIEQRTVAQADTKNATAPAASAPPTPAGAPPAKAKGTN